MRNFYWSFFVLTVLLSVISCREQTELKDGVWRGELTVAGNKKAPFLFETSRSQTDSATVTLRNGEERVDLTGATFHGDTLVIPIAAYDAVIKGFVGGGKIEGKFIKNYIENDPGVPFSAIFGQHKRFEPTDKPTSEKIDGKWDVLFIGEKGDTTRNVGIFKSDNGIVTGSVLTHSGDLRYLEGIYTETGAKLSAFSGLSPYLIEIAFAGSARFSGNFYTTRSITRIEGTRNDRAELSDPYSLAKLRPGCETLSFHLPNLNGKVVSLQDESYRDKVIIVSILGSWCPNCLDETAYLAPWYDANKQRGVEIIGIAFERKNDFNYAKETLSRLKNRYQINYELLFGGEVGKESIGKILPELENFSSYPSTLFIDKKGKVRKIHTGFSGPATGLFYEEFKKDFNTLIDHLLAE
ncbi:MAG: TlpA family protein disulfide reductase [Dysgonamonadaceae bacterium]|jgi:peroxiredoxin|nr:TlpA family protein disulfide reductase [Dysgonamonadaceae bacterium]